MTQTINTGIAASILFNKSLTDTQYFAVGCLALAVLKNLGVDVAGLVSLSGGTLTLDSSIGSDAAVNAAFRQVFGRTYSQLVGSNILSLDLAGGELTQNADGSIATVGGSVLFQGVAGTGGTYLSTLFFNPPDLETAIADAATLTAAMAPLINLFFGDYFYLSTLVDYSYLGSGVNETINLGLGFSSGSSFGGKDIYLGKDNGYGQLDGGSGADTFSGELMSTRLSVNLQLGTAGTIGGSQTYQLTRIENLLGTGLNDILKGNGVGNLINGGGGRDVINGQTGNDSLLGGGGNDRIYGGTGEDTMRGSAGHDLLYGGDNDDRLFGDSGQDSLNGGKGNDLHFGGLDKDAFIFVPFADQGDDFIFDFNPAEGDKIRFVGPGFDISQVVITHDPVGTFTLVTWSDGAGGTNILTVLNYDVLVTDIEFFAN